MSTELTVNSGNGGGLPGLRNALMPRSFGEVMTFANEIANSAFVGKDFRGKPGEIIAAITYGAELGLSPMQSLQSIAVINGKPSIYGDGLLAVCQNHPQWAGKEEYQQGDTAHCIVRRKGEPDVHSTFSVADAKAAQLLGKMGPWTQYRNRMLQMRARGFALRDQYADALKGIITVEEARDYPAPVGPDRARDVTPGPIADPAEHVVLIDQYGAVCETDSPDAWIKDVVTECASEEELQLFVENNPGNTNIQLAASLELEKRKAKAAKPNGNGKPITFEVRDATGKVGGTFGTLAAAIDGLGIVSQSLPDAELGPTTKANRALLELAMDDPSVSAEMRRWASEQVDWLMAQE